MAKGRRRGRTKQELFSPNSYSHCSNKKDEELQSKWKIVILTTMTARAKASRTKKQLWAVAVASVMKGVFFSMYQSAVSNKCPAWK